MYKLYIHLHFKKYNKLKMCRNNKNQQNKITCYNIFIKDSFNVIYNRHSSNFLPKHIKDDIMVLYEDSSQKRN